MPLPSPRTFWAPSLQLPGTGLSGLSWGEPEGSWFRCEKAGSLEGPVWPLGEEDAGPARAAHGDRADRVTAGACARGSLRVMDSDGHRGWDPEGTWGLVLVSQPRQFVPHAVWGPEDRAGQGAGGRVCSVNSEQE